MRVPSYYCPHCGRFKKLFQVEWCEYSLNFYCRHCGNRIMETEELFLDIVKQICAKRDGKESEDAEIHSTTDVEEVRQGEWEEVNGVFFCTRCGDSSTSMTAYCCNCGAEMRLKRKESGDGRTDTD